MKKAFAFVGLALAAALLVPATTQTADIPVAPSATHQVNKDIPIAPKVSYIVREGLPGGDETAYIVRGKKKGHDIEVQRDIPISPRETAYIVRGFDSNTDPGTGTEPTEPTEPNGTKDSSVLTDLLNLLKSGSQTAYIVRDGLPTGDETAYIVRGKKHGHNVVVG